MHPGLPALPRLGARDRRVHVRPRPRPPRSRRGVFKDIVLARATDPVLAEVGQDGGLVSAILVYALEHDIIDAALVCYLEGDGSTWKAIPGVARTRDDIIASAGQPLHVLGEHAWRTPRPSRAAPSASRSSA